VSLIVEWSSETIPPHLVALYWLDQWRWAWETDEWHKLHPEPLTDDA